VSFLAEFEITKAKDATDIAASDAFPGKGMIMYAE
jgi:hypothetical protein